MVSTKPGQEEATTVASVSSAPPSAHDSKHNESNDNLIVQYILIRTDLDWGTGAMIAQACHASVAAITRTMGDTTTKDYLADLDSMHKVILKADKLDDITKAATKLNEANIAHHVWVERPENVISCLAVSPQPKTLIKSIFKHLKLLR